MFLQISSLSKLTLQLKLKSLRVNQAIKIYNWQVSFVGLLTSLSIEQFSAINNVKMALGQQNGLKLNRQVRDAVIEVAKIVHQDDLIEIFTTLRKFDVSSRRKLTC
jgi:hypothetical protein